MAEAAPNTTGAAATFNPASNAETEHGHPLPDAAHDTPPTVNEKANMSHDVSSNSSQLKPEPHSDAASVNGHSGSDVADEKGPPGDQPPEEVRKITGIKWALVVSSILSSTFLFALDNTVVADVQPSIVDRFGEIQKLAWLPIAFLVAAVSTNLIWGKIYGQFNAKWLYIGNVFLFEVGSALCGAAPTMNALIGGRVLAGLGGAGLYIGVMTLLSVNTTEHERPVYIGMTGMTWGLGTVLGPVSQSDSISSIMCGARCVHSNGFSRSLEVLSLRAVSDGVLLSTSTVSCVCLAFLRAST